MAALFYTASLLFAWCVGEVGWFKELGWTTGRSGLQFRPLLFQSADHFFSQCHLHPNFHSHTLHDKLRTLLLRGLCKVPLAHQWMETRSLCVQHFSYHFALTFLCMLHGFPKWAFVGKSITIHACEAHVHSIGHRPSYWSNSAWKVLFATETIVDEWCSTHLLG